MEENNSTELEEGEACFYKEEEGDNSNIDPDIALSYIDEKIQNVLGHFQKDFEGGFTAENLGAKFGGYGSFLPTYERSPYTSSRQKSPERSSILTKPQNSNLSAEGVSRDMRAPATVPPSRFKAAQCNADKLHNAKFPSGDLSVKQVNQDLHASSNPVAEKPTGDKTLIKSGKQSNQRPLKVRIKMGSNTSKKTNAALYSGLGLEGSPSTSLGSSSQESGGFQPLSVGITCESPCRILQVMTTLPVPSPDLISPLHENLLSFVKEVHKDNKPAENVKVRSGQNTVAVDQLVTVQGDVMLSKLKKIKPEGRNKNPEVKNGEASTILGKPKIKMLDEEADNLEKASLSSTGNNSGELRKRAAKASEVLGEANNIKVKRKLKSNSVNESRLKPTCGLDDNVEVKSGQKIRIVKGAERGVASSPGAATFDSMENSIRRGGAISELPKDRWDVAKNKEEFVTGKADCLNWKADHEVPCHEHNDSGFPFRDEKPLLGGKKKSKASQSDDIDILPGKERLRIVAGLAGRDRKKFSHDINLSKKKHTAGLGNEVDALERSNGEQDYIEAPSFGKRRDAGSTFAVVENDSVLANSKEMNTNGFISISSSGVHVKGAVDSAIGVPSSDVVPPDMEDWVCCDKCNQWRLLPKDIKPEHLPKKWMCSMLNWLPEMNSCDVSEDVTTGIMRGVIPYPGLESQNYTNGSTFGVNCNVKHLGQNPPYGSTVAVDGRGKIKLGQKEMLKKSKGEPVKSRSLNIMNPLPAEWNSLGRCNISDNKSQDMALGENIQKKKEKNLNMGDRNLIKEKRKRKSDQFEFETSKRAKRDEISNGATHGKSDMEVCGTGFGLGTPKVTLVKGKGHSSEGGSVTEVKDGLKGRIILSVKNPNNQLKVSKDCTSLDIKASGPVKKRKLKGSQDNQIDGEPYHHPELDRKLVAEETDDCMLRKGNKSGFSGTVVKDSSSRDGNSKPMKEGKAIRNFSSGIRKRFTDGVEGDLLLPSNCRKEMTPKQATSSSSKVSGSQKSRVKYEVQGSPVESVSSSPLRVTKSAKFTSVGSDVLTRGHAINGILHVMDNVGEGSGEKIKSGGKLSGIVMEKESSGVRLESLECDHSKKDDRPLLEFENGHNLDSGAYVQSGTALRLQKNGSLYSSISNGKGRSSQSNSVREKITPNTAGAKVAEHQNEGKIYESPVNANHASPFGKVQRHVDGDTVMKNVKNHVKRRDLLKQNDRRLDNRYSDFGLESPSENTCPDRMEGAPLSAESMSSKAALLSQAGEEVKQGTPSWGSQPVGQKNAHSGLDLSEALMRNKENGASTSVELITSEMHQVKDVLSSSPSRANQSLPTACNVLKEAEKLRGFAEHLKVNKFGFESNESYFKAAMKFLQGAGLLESGKSEGSRHEEMTPLQVYSRAAKLFESCAAEFERCQELAAAAALAYKCMEVAYMRVVNRKYASLIRDRHELQATLQQGESPSSSASDIDNLNNQAVAERSNLFRGAGSHAVGNHIVNARNRPSFVRLLDFTQDIEFAMEASKKSQVAFLAANEIMEESQNREHIITSVKKVIDFSFQDVDGLVRLVQHAMEAINRSGFSGAKN